MSKTIYQIVECNTNFEIIATTGKFYQKEEDALSVVKKEFDLYQKVDEVDVERWSLHPWDTYKDAYLHQVTVHRCFTKSFKGQKRICGIASYSLS